VFTLLAKLHGLLFRLCLWLGKQPFKMLWFTLAAVLSLLNEEIRRYLGLLLWGVVIFLAGKATLNYAPDGMKLPLVLTALGLECIWGLAVLRSIRFTRRNNLYRQRQQRFFRELRGEVGQLGGRVETLRADLGRRARGTPFEGMWQSNRDHRADEQREPGEQERCRQGTHGRAAQRAAVIGCRRRRGDEAHEQ